MLGIVKNIVDIILGVIRISSSTKQLISRANNTEDIKFDYSCDEIRANGWELSYNDKPKIENKKEKKIGGYLMITPKTPDPDSYHIQYEDYLSDAQATNNEVSFLVQSYNTTILYLRVETYNQKSNEEKCIWLKLRTSNVRRGVEKTRHEDEWIVYGKAQKRGNKWHEVHVNIRDTLFKIDKLNGFEFSRIIAIRIRGKIGIAKIEFND